MNLNETWMRTCINLSFICIKKYKEMQTKNLKPILPNTCAYKHRCKSKCQTQCNTVLKHKKKMKLELNLNDPSMNLSFTCAQKQKVMKKNSKQISPSTCAC